MVAPITNIPMPTDLAKEMEARAAKMGMTLPVYMAFLARVQIRRHDPRFVDAAKHLLNAFPESLRKLAQ